MNEGTALDRLRSARVGRMATADAAGVPHVVPVVFVLERRTAYWAVDRKPKRSRRLKRLENIRANPNVELVVDSYGEDWSSLWWVRARGRAHVVEDDETRSRALSLLAEKYPQYGRDPPDGPIIAVEISRMAWWEATPT